MNRVFMNKNNQWRLNKLWVGILFVIGVVSLFSGKASGAPPTEPWWFICSEEIIKADQCMEFTRFYYATVACKLENREDDKQCLKKHGYPMEKNESRPAAATSTGSSVGGVAGNVVQQKSSQDSAQSASGMIFLSYGLAVAFAIFLAKQLSGSSVVTPFQIAKRWMLFGSMPGVIKAVGAGLYGAMGGAIEVDREVVEGIILFIAFSLMGFVFGYIWGLWRCRLPDSRTQKLAGQVNTITQEKSLGEPSVTVVDQSADVNENEIFKKIAVELETGKTDKAIWTKAFAMSDGDEKMTRVNYIKLRFESLGGTP